MVDLTEAQFQSQIVAYAQLRGWLVSHVQSVTMAGRGGRVIRQTPAARGFPDLTLAREGQVWFLEVKSERGSVSRDQKRWLAAIGGIDPDDPGEDWGSRGVTPWALGNSDNGGVMVVRPRHWQWIQETLK